MNKLGKLACIKHPDNAVVYFGGNLRFCEACNEEYRRETFTLPDADGMLCPRPPQAQTDWQAWMDGI